MNLSQMQYYKQQNGYTFARLSELSGVPVGTIQKIFNGETKSPRYDTLQALEKVLRPEGEEAYVRESAAAYRVSYTLDDYYGLPEERRAELIDGVLYDMTAPTVPHQSLAGEIFFEIKNYIRKKRGTCVVLEAPVDVQLDCDDKTMVQPDVLVVCDRDKLTNRCVMGAPDFIVEVLSPSTRRKDMFLKLAKYEHAGVREYWMVDMENEKIITYSFEGNGIPVVYGMDAKVPVQVFEGKLAIDFRVITRQLEELNLDEE